jgi:hypothetical protein
VHKWQRIKKQAAANLQAYGAHGVTDLIWSNWFRAGKRKMSWYLARQVFQIQLFGWCPVRRFHALGRWLALAPDVRENYNRRAGYTPYA